MKLAKRLTPAVIEALKPEADPYRVWDTQVPALFVRVQPTGIRSFNVAWTRLNSKSLGKWPSVTIEGARTRARAMLVERDKHGAPLAVIEARKPASAKPITFGAFIATVYTPWARSRQKQPQATLDALKAQFVSWYDTPVAEITATDIDRFTAERIAAGIKPATVRRDRDRIRAVLYRALREGYITTHPMAGMERLKGDDNTRVRYLTAAEEKRLRAALAKRETERRKARASGVAWREARGHDGAQPWPRDAYTDHLMPLVLLAMNTGLRRGELFGIRWSDVNLDEKRLTVPAGIAKSRKGRAIPLNTEARAVLTRWRGGTERGGLVFASPAGGRMTNINKSWDALVTSAQLENFKFHDLRHHFASRMVQAGVDLYAVKTLLGHSDFSMTQRYAHLAPDHLAAAVAKVGAR